MNNLIKIGNQEISEIKWNNERVITTAQLADVYKTDVNNVQANFGRNQEHFAEGKHYYLLKGNELKDFKHYLTDSQVVAKNAPCLYLWTRRGASRHCKILDTDRAWEQFDCLEETYFNKKKPLSATEQLRLQSQAIGEIDERVTSIDNDLQSFKQDMPILGIEESKITDAVRRKGVQCLGGKDSEAYKDRSLRSKVYADIYSELKRQFGVTSYKAIKRSQCNKAVDIIERYELPLILKEQIKDANSQMRLYEAS